MASSVEVRTLADKLAARLRDESFGEIKVRHAEAWPDRDSLDAEAIFLTLRLSDPIESTWSHDSVLLLRRAIPAIARELGIDVPIIVRLLPESEEPQEEDEQQLFGD